LKIFIEVHINKKMNNTINHQLFEKMINLSIIVGNWSQCVNNIQTRNISIYDQNNNSYSFNKEQLNKQGIFITERASNCPNKFTWETGNIVILVSMLTFMTCVIAKWCHSSEMCNVTLCKKKKKSKETNSMVNKDSIEITSTTPMPIHSSRNNLPDVQIL